MHCPAPGLHLVRVEEPPVSNWSVYVWSVQWIYEVDGGRGWRGAAAGFRLMKTWAWTKEMEEGIENERTKVGERDNDRKRRERGNGRG